jgi:hypothetical protein
MENYLYIPIKFLEAHNISKCDFMKSSPNALILINNLLNKISPILKIKDTFLIKNYFLLILENKDSFHIDNETLFLELSNYIRSSKFISYISINDKKRELSIKKDVPPIFYYVLNEFLV